MTDAAIDWSACPVVETNPDLLGGTPVVKGTRCPVEAIYVNFDDGEDPDTIAFMFEVSTDTVRTILAFREAHSNQR